MPPKYSERSPYQIPESPTEGWVEIVVEPEYLIAESQQSGQSIFAYHVTVSNQGPIPVQLLSRYWLITDGAGAKREVMGDGVVGAQPWIEPGQSYEYSSFSPLPTPTGNMRGSYEFRSREGSRFKAKIPLFFLRSN